MYECTAAEYIEKLPKGYQSCKGMGKTEPNPTDELILENGCKGLYFKVYRSENHENFQCRSAKALTAKLLTRRCYTMSTSCMMFPK